MKFTMFNNLAIWFDNNTLLKNKEEKYFQNNFDKYYALGNYNFCYKMIEKGYKISKLRQKRLDNKVLGNLSLIDYEIIKDLKSFPIDIKMRKILSFISNENVEDFSQSLIPKIKEEPPEIKEEKPYIDNSYTLYSKTYPYKKIKNASEEELNDLEKNDEKKIEIKESSYGMITSPKIDEKLLVNEIIYDSLLSEKMESLYEYNKDYDSKKSKEETMSYTDRIIYKFSKLLASNTKEDIMPYLDYIKNIKCEIDKDTILKYNKSFIKEYQYEYSYNKHYRHEDNFTIYGKIDPSNLIRLINLNLILIKSQLLTSEEIKELYLDFKELKKVYDNNKYTLNIFMKGLEIYLPNLFKNDDSEEEILKKLESYNNKEQKKDLTLIEKVNCLVISDKYSLNLLPEEAKIILERIDSFSKKSEEKEIKEFIDNNLPIILKKYFSVDVEYRDTLKNIQGLNAQELMIKSLEGVETIIYANKKENNVNALKELSIEARKYKRA